MNIIKNYKTERLGNDCLIISAVALLEVRRNYYLVISTERADGSWTDYEASTSVWDFTTLGEAEVKYNKLEKGIKRYE